MVRILISGASGFVGAPLLAQLQAKHHEVIPLHRSFSLEKLSDIGPFDVVIHLAGEPLGFGRWSESKQHAILTSRAVGTRELCEALASLPRPPSLFLSASAVGYYGNRGNEVLSEDSSQGQGFLANVCSEWERGSLILANRKVRTVQARFGIVLGRGGGIMKKLLPLYRFGLGGKLGSGEQWVSWVALPDLICALEYILEHSDIQGPVNFVSPCPVQQKTFAKALARAVRRPAFFSVPACVLRSSLGLMAEELLLSSQRAVPQKLLASGFAFRFSSLEDALTECIS